MEVNILRVSVIMLIYNADYLRIKATLKSIVIQKNIELELIIADDGSNISYEEEIKKFLSDYANIPFMYLKSKKNMGTVLNFCKGVQKAKGKYVKPISPGDCFYDADSLKKIVDFMETNYAKVAFGLAAFYFRTDSNNITVVPKNSPELYRDYDKTKYRQKRIINNLLIYKDNILGAGLCYEKNTLTKYLEIITNRVCYVEDFVTYFMAVDGIQIYCFSEYMLWYEFGEGVSTGVSKEWDYRIWKDREVCFEILGERERTKIVNTAQLLHKTYVFKNVFLKKLVRILIEPRLIIFKLRKKSVSKMTVDEVELNHIRCYYE